MKRVEFLFWILMIVNIFWIYSLGREGLAFILMSIYAILGGIFYKLECDLVEDYKGLLERCMGMVK